MKPKLPSKLPSFLHRFFWDVEAKKLNPRQYPFYIAQRLMDKGDLPALRWLKKNFSNQELKEVYLKSRQLSKFSRPFWAAYLKIFPLKKLCSKKEFRQKPGVAWPY